jgi:hypothetical protein
MNDELHKLYDENISDHRMGYSHGTEDYWVMRERDRQRRECVQDFISDNQVTLAVDYYYAACIFQHGDSPEDAWQAHRLALKAAELGEQRALWLTAAAYDRYLMYQGKPQKYGTQYISDGKRQRLWDVDPQTSDEERAAWNVPPLVEQLRKAEEVTRIQPQTPVPDDAPQWLKAAIQRWQQEEGEGD